MCVVCIEWEKGKLTNEEAKRAIKEMLDDPDKIAHLSELRYKIEEAEINEED